MSALPALAVRRIRPADDLVVRVLEDIDDVPAAEWDSILEPEDLQASHRFVKLCADSGVENARYRYVMAYDEDGLAAIAVLTRMSVALDLLAAPEMRGACGWVRRVHPGFLRLHLGMCGLPVSFGDSCLRLRMDVAPEPLVARIALELERCAEDLGASLLCFKEHSPSDAGKLGALAEASYCPAPSLPFYSLPIHWRSFGEYLQAMRSSYRHQALATLRVRDRAGLLLRTVEHFDADCPQLFALYEQVMDRAPVQMERLNLRFFQGLDRVFGHRSRALFIERQGEILASAILLDGPHVSTFLLAGIDYSRSREHQAYLNLVLAIVEDAISRGARLLRLGQTSDRLKARVGAEAEPRLVFLRHRSAFVHRLLAASRGALFPERPAPRRRVFAA